MACIFKRNGIWQVKMKRGGKWIYKSLRTTSKAEAVRLKARAEQLEDAPPVIPAYATVTLNDLLPLVVSDGLALNSRKAIYRAIRAAGEAFTSAPVHTLTRREIVALRASWDVQPTTANHYLAMLALVVSRAIKQGIFQGRNPFKVPTLKTPRRAPQWLTSEQMQDVITLARDHGADTYHTVLLGLYAGMRAGEIEHATYAWLDHPRRLVHIQATGEWVPKGNKDRTLPMHRALAGLTGEGQVVHVTSSQLRRNIRSIAHSLALPWLTPHVLRHTFASQAVMAGVPLYTVSAWLGHASITTTQVYAHLAPQHHEMDRWG